MSANIHLFSVKTIADRHKLAAYCNKHCWPTFQHWWPWTTFRFSNFCDFSLRCIFQQWIAPKLLEIDQDNSHNLRMKFVT